MKLTDLPKHVRDAAKQRHDATVAASQPPARSKESLQQEWADNYYAEQRAREAGDKDAAERHKANMDVLDAAIAKAKD